MSYTIILFYKYVPIEDPEALRLDQHELAASLDLTGRMIIAPEGINGTFEGEAAHIEAYCRALTADPRFGDIDIKTSEGPGNAFPKLSVKVRDEIVSSHLGQEVDPREDTGMYLTPDELRAWYREEKEFTVIDMRNDYEFVSGHFEGSVHPGMRHFRELPERLDAIAHLKDQPVVPVCTGGVRCEKASAYLKKQGFKEVYQLEGGIHRYMEKYPGEDFKGTLYVFDRRVTMDTAPADQREVVGVCRFCEAATEQYVDDDHSVPSLQFLCCDDCLAKRSDLRPAKLSRGQCA